MHDNREYLQQDGMFIKLSMARTKAEHVRINYNKLGKIAYHVENLPEIFYSKNRARLSHTMALHNCKQRAVMDQLQQYLQNILTEHLQKEHGSLCTHMDTKQQSNSSHRLGKITKSLKSETSRSLVCMLVLVTKEIKKIHGIHLCKDGMAHNKTHVELMTIRCTE